MGFLKFATELAVGSTLMGGLVSVGIAGLTLRATIGVVEFERRIIVGTCKYVASRGLSLPSHPEYPKNSDQLFLEEESESLSESQQVVEDFTELVEEKGEDKEGKEVVISQKRVINRHSKSKFIRYIAIEAKNHFGGDLCASKANYLSVSKFLTGKCKERQVVPAHTRVCVASAMALVFTPDMAEVQMRVALNSHEAYRRRVAMEAAGSMSSWGMRLIQNPLTNSAWEEAWYVLNGRSSRSAVTFTK
ncbi:p28K [Adonis mosaic virus]|uniref:p28K n=2 Tax=Adonis mosaic virus TaxID=1883104 RepID=A0A1J1DNU2_9TOMB|nr:p28K [Adonis mosaic virus]BAV91503.1 p28K [Adonis mosaic virus]